MRRIIVLILVVMIVCLSIPTINAAGTNPAFEADKVIGKRGDTVEVGIKLKNNPGITALQLSITYSVADLELLSIDDGGVFSNPISHSNLNSKPIIISWFASDSSNVSDNGTIAKLTFRIRDNAQSSAITVSYNPDNVFNSSFDNVSFETESGSVTVKEQSLTGVSINKLPIKTSYIIGDVLDTTGLQLLAQYDDNTTEIITEGFTTSGFSSLTAGEKKVTVSYLGKTTSFNVIVEAPLVPSFSVNSVSGSYGDTVEVELSIDNNPGITALQLIVDYSASDLRLVSIEDGGVFSESITYSSLETKPIVISWFASDSTDRMVNGTLAKMKFRILDSAKTNTIALSFDEDNVFNSSFNNIGFETVNGTVSVSAGILGDVDGDGETTIIDATFIQRYNVNMQIPITEEKMNKCGDVDGDGEVTVIDATFIQRYGTMMFTPYPIGEPIFV